MIRYVLDTGVLVAGFRREKAGRALAERRYPWLLSAVVLSELRRGVDTPVERRLVDNLARTRPALAPEAGHWERSGTILARLRREHDFDARGLRAIQNDTLLAVQAHALGAVVVTTNVADFVRLAAFLPGFRHLAFNET